MNAKRLSSCGGAHCLCEIPEVPTVYTKAGPSHVEDDHLVSVRLPADVADELMLIVVWLSVQLEHRVPVPALRRAVLFGGLAHPDRVLAALRADAGHANGRLTF